MGKPTSVRTFERLAVGLTAIVAGCGARTISTPSDTSGAGESSTTTPGSSTGSSPTTDAPPTTSATSHDGSTTSSDTTGDTSPMCNPRFEYSCDDGSCSPNDDDNCGECGKVCPKHGGFGGCHKDTNNCEAAWSDACFVPDGVTNCNDVCAMENARATNVFDQTQAQGDLCSIDPYLVEFHEIADCDSFANGFSTLWTEIPCDAPIPSMIVTAPDFDPAPMTRQEVLGAHCFCDVDDVY